MKRLLIFATGVLTLLVTTAVPAGAGTALPAVQANALCTSQFSSLSALRTQATSTLPRGKEREPRLGKSGLRSELARAKGHKGGRNFKVKIPVYVHVITDGENGQVSRRTINEQMSVLNLAFAGFYGGVDTGFRFKLKKIDRTDNARWFNVNPATDPEAEVQMKQALHRGDSNDLNLYTTFGNGYLGYAYFPDIVADPQSYLDGAVIDFQSMPGGAYGDAFSLGQTATHEVGHWLGLWHTFDNTEGAFGPEDQDPNTWPPVPCSGMGDEVEDTPAMLVPTGGCPVGKDTCTQPGLDPIHNYMDYSFDSCYDQFTAGQRARTQSQYLFWRDGGKREDDDD